MVGDRLNVEVTEGAIRHSGDANPPLARVRLSVALAAPEASSGWQIRASSQKIPLRRQVTDGVLKDTLRFSIPLPPAADLAEHWLVFRFEWPQTHEGMSGTASTYAHTERRLFASP